MGVGSAEFHATDMKDIRSARHLLASHLKAWGCIDADAVLLVFSELVTNALLHGGSASRIAVTHRSNVTSLAIEDRNRQPPEVQPEGSEVGGYGLRIVEELASRWGWNPTDTGKQVWAVIECGQ